MAASQWGSKFDRVSVVKSNDLGDASALLWAGRIIGAGTACVPAIRIQGGKTMRVVTAVIGLVLGAASFGAASEPEANKASLAQRIPVLLATDAIEVSSNDSDSAAYVVVRLSGQLIFVPYRSAKSKFPDGSQSTAAAVVDFTAWHAKLSQQAVLEKTSPGDRLVYFVRKAGSSSAAVFIPARDAAALQLLFEPFLKPSKTPP
jgi:hypothetical protein